MAVTRYPHPAATGASVNIAQNHILVGNAAGIGADVAMSGDATIVASGALTIANGAITNVKVSDSAAIQRVKLATGTANSVAFNNATGVLVDTTLTASRALTSNTIGLLAVSATTATELGFVSGVTSAIQTQLDGKVTTAAGGGFKVTSNTLSTSRTISSVHPTYSNVTDLSITFTSTFNNQVVIFVFMGAVFSAGGPDVAFLGYKLDSDADVPTTSCGFTAGNYQNGSFAVPVTIATAGSHTITVRAAKSATNYSVVVDAANAPKAMVIQ